MRLISAGINHKSASLDLREKLAFAGEKLQRGLNQLLDQGLLDEAMILSTCNRVEIYGATSRPELGKDQLERFLTDFHGLPPESLRESFYFHEGEGAVLHGYRVASSLDSMVIGEPQIVKQMKDAYEIASEAGSVGGILHRYMNRVFNVSKRVRSETEISSGAVSISFMAVLLAKKIFGDLKDKKVLLLGAGKMSHLAARHLKGQGVAEIWVANRSFEKAREMALECGGKPLPFDDFYFSIPQVDMVITSVACEDYVLKPEHVAKAMKLRKNAPMFIIDIAVPRNVDPAINDLYNVYLYDLNDLQGLVASNQKERLQEAQKGEAIAQQEAKRFIAELEKLAVTPTIHLLSTKFEKIRKQELQKALGKLRDLSPEHAAVLEAMSAAIVSKILHDPLLALKAQGFEKEHHPHSYLEIIQKIFRLDEL